MPHIARPAHDARHPVHVTFKSCLRSLRSQFVFPTVRLTLASLRHRQESFRIVHFSVQGNHVHLLVEATDKRALSAGLRALAIRVALRLNRLLMRHGRVWVERCHQHVLSRPRAVRNALVYVLGNHRKHGVPTASRLDACSSAPFFDGFHDVARAPPADLGQRTLAASRKSPVSPARTWLLLSGWKRHGFLSASESPRR